jgi:hypothetical protein
MASRSSSILGISAQQDVSVHRRLQTQVNFLQKLAQKVKNTFSAICRAIVYVVCLPVRFGKFVIYYLNPKNYGKTTKKVVSISPRSAQSQNARRLEQSMRRDEVMTFSPADVARDRLGRTPLHNALIRKDKAEVKRLVGVGSPLNVRDRDDKKTPLHLAVDWGDEEIVRLLVTADGIDPNIPDKRKKTPLHYAAAGSGKDGIVRILLENGANYRATDSLHRMPLHDAIDWSKFPSMMLLVSSFLSGESEGDAAILFRRFFPSKDRVIQNMTGDLKRQLGNYFAKFLEHVKAYKEHYIKVFDDRHKLLIIGQARISREYLRKKEYMIVVKSWAETFERKYSNRTLRKGIDTIRDTLKAIEGKYQSWSTFQSGDGGTVLRERNLHDVLDVLHLPNVQSFVDMKINTPLGLSSRDHFDAYLTEMNRCGLKRESDFETIGVKIDLIERLQQSLSNIQSLAGSVEEILKKYYDEIVEIGDDFIESVDRQFSAKMQAILDEMECFDLTNLDTLALLLEKYMEICKLSLLAYFSQPHFKIFWRGNVSSLVSHYFSSSINPFKLIKEES